MDCLFCKIAAGKIPADKVYEDERVLAFKDISPVSPVHILIIPKTHIHSAAEIDEDNADIVGKIFSVAARLAGELNLAGGFRVVTNSGADGGQTVGHLHFHLLGGRELGWPPG